VRVALFAVRCFKNHLRGIFDGASKKTYTLKKGEKHG
jgi:hypothetical protein